MYVCMYCRVYQGDRKGCPYPIRALEVASFLLIIMYVGMLPGVIFWLEWLQYLRSINSQRRGTRAAQAPPPIIHPAPAPTRYGSCIDVGAGEVGMGGEGACAALVLFSVPPYLQIA